MEPPWWLAGQKKHKDKSDEREKFSEREREIERQ
jgi:hypothetical protein